MGTVNLPVWEYGTPGPLRERLNGLTLAGAKTATFAIDEITLSFDEPLERVGDRFVMVGTNGAQLAVIEITGLERTRLGDVHWEQVAAEGESFENVDAWREAHIRFWTPFVERVRTFRGDPAWVVNADTVVTCLRVRLIERLRGHDAARYPVVECIVETSEAELAVDALDGFGTTGVEEIDGGLNVRSTNGREVPAGSVFLRAGFASDSAAVLAEAGLAREWRPRYEVLLGDDWLDAWREHFTSLRVGRFVIVPDWSGASDSRPDPLPDDVLVRLDPARSFGTGAHTSTRLVLDAMQTIALTGARVADVGCGSGVLSVAALLSGATSVVATDIEAAALDATLDNAGRNGVANRCRVAGTLPPGERFDVVLANILAPVLISLAGEVGAAVEPGGTLILAGLIDEQVERVLAAYTGFAIVCVGSEDRWRSVVLTRPL